MIQPSHFRPIFIIGNPRSGTSLLRLMLSCHPDILIPPESHFFLWLENKYENINPSTDKLDQFFIDLYNSRKFETWGIDETSIMKLVRRLRPHNYSGLIASIYLAYADKVGKTGIEFWGDKNKLWKDKLGRIIHYYPEAFFIHLVRDGRDVACSFKDLAIKNSSSSYAPKLPVEIIEIADRWKNNVGCIEAFLEDIPRAHTLTIRYEDLIMDAESNLKKITDILGISYSANMLNYQNPEFTEIMEPVEFLEWKEKLNASPDEKNIGKYKTQLSQQDILLFEQYAGKELKKYEYLI
jgi:hypothetical protein